MKRNLMINSFLVAFGLLFAVTAQDKGGKAVKKEIKIVKAGELGANDSMVWIVKGDKGRQKTIFMHGENFIINEDSLEKTITVITNDHTGHRAFFNFDGEDDKAKRSVNIETLVDENGDTTIIKTIIMGDNGHGNGKMNFQFAPPPPPPHPMPFNHMESDPLELLLNDPAYEIIAYERNIKKGVEVIEIKRKKKE